jgi:hypothetical protein
MSGAVPQLPQYALMAWCSVKAQGQLYLYPTLDGGEWSVSHLDRFTHGVRIPGTHWLGGWVGPRAGLDTVTIWNRVILEKPQEPTSGQIWGLVEHFIASFFFLRLVVLSPSPSPQVGGPPIVGCSRLFFIIFVATPHFWRLSPTSVTRWRDMSWWQGPT